MCAGDPHSPPLHGLGRVPRKGPGSNLYTGHSPVLARSHPPFWAVWPGPHGPRSRERGHQGCRSVPVSSSWNICGHLQPHHVPAGMLAVRATLFQAPLPGPHNRLSQARPGAGVSAPTAPHALDRLPLSARACEHRTCLSPSRRHFISVPVKNPNCFSYSGSPIL